MNVNRNETRARPRRGYAVVELALAVFVLMAAMGVTVRVLGWVGHDRRAADRRQWAVQAVANVMERITVRTADEVTAGSSREVVEAANAGRFLPGAEWDVSVDEAGGPVGGKRVTLRLRWKEPSGGWNGPVRLTSWVYRRGRPS